MVNLFVLLLVGVAVFAQSACAGRITVDKPEIVMVDTGLNFQMTGPLRMEERAVPKAENRPDWRVHGTYMALSLMDQIKRLNMGNVDAEMVRWGIEQDLVTAIEKAVELNPKVISLSLSGESPILREKKAIEKACLKNILVVAASGNRGIGRPDYPAGYDLPCLVSVSSFYKGKIPALANLGQIYVPLFFSHEKGTSYSTARAAAYALDYLRKNPGKSAIEAKKWLLDELGPKQSALQWPYGRQ